MSTYYLPMQVVNVFSGRETGLCYCTHIIPTPYRAIDVHEFPRVALLPQLSYHFP